MIITNILLYWKPYIGVMKTLSGLISEDKKNLQKI